MVHRTDIVEEEQKQVSFYFEELYELTFQHFSLDTSGVMIPVLDAPIREEPPTLTKVRKETSKLKGDKAAGFCWIHTELVRAGDHLWRVIACCPECHLAVRHHSLRQGCLIVSTVQYLYGLGMGELLSCDSGATLGNSKVSDLDFANVDVLSESLGTLVVTLDAFRNEAKPSCLELRWYLSHR